MAANLLPLFLRRRQLPFTARVIHVVLLLSLHARASNGRPLLQASNGSALVCSVRAVDVSLMQTRTQQFKGSKFSDGGKNEIASSLLDTERKGRFMNANRNSELHVSQARTPVAGSKQKGGIIRVKLNSELQITKSDPASGKQVMVAVAENNGVAAPMRPEVSRATMSRPPPKNPPLLRALSVGMIYGLVHAAAPDHMGTLMTLSAMATPRAAFSAGASWGLGHCVGITWIAIAFIICRRISGQRSFETWEHYGDYCVGLSMVLCASYFMLYESYYVRDNGRGGLTLRRCSCKDHAGAASSAEQAPEEHPHCMPCSGTADQAEVIYTGRRHRMRLMSNAYKKGIASGQTSAKDAAQDDVDRSTSDVGSRLSEVPTTETIGRTYSGVLLGTIQGACCPMSLMGMTFLSTLSASGITFFALSFFAVSSISTGLIAMFWAYFTTLASSEGQQIFSGCSPKVVYRASCCFTLALGMIWLLASCYGVIDKLEFGEVNF